VIDRPAPGISLGLDGAAVVAFAGNQCLQLGGSLCCLGDVIADQPFGGIVDQGLNPSGHRP
jgi:hypothetical protein